MTSTAGSEFASRTAVFAAAARWFGELLGRVPDTAWEGPGLGAWDLRALVGHASRSLVTVSTYLRSPAADEDARSAADYYAQVASFAAAAGPAAIVERGRQAGRDLGDDPVTTFGTLVDTALADVAAAGDPLIQVIGGIGIRLGNYLPTRTFELAVHGLDVARATRLSHELPGDVLLAANALAVEIAVATGSGAAVLLALTGREPLAPRFSVV